ncbi:hypothetical protein GYM73_03455 [Apibacter sp. ESL0432]|uniref:immunity 8 family protein n=1 Tax=Apibacter TaxID=1778601 RepID=UPI001C6A13DB|nr:MULTISPECIES: immunity 8 family protein [Apibacter]QYN48695.1 hypothetical protein GYM73_03455 [Apibacter sp. ESL0432]
MKAVLNRIYRLDDFGEYLSDYFPLDKFNFNVPIRMIVGESMNKGEESFDLTICTPKWLLQNMKEEDIFFARHYLIVKEYDYARIYNYIKKYVDGLTGDTWDEIGLKLSRIGYWEFEDYKE